MPIASLDAFGPRTTPVALVPSLARRVGPDLTLQRLRFHKGRTLTAAALRLEAANHEARFGFTGRALNDGVVEGFQIALGDQAAAPGAFTLTPGFAIAPSGQDLTLGRPVRLVLRDLPRRSTAGAAVPATPAGVGVLVIEPVSGEETRFVDDADRQAAFRRTAQLDPAAAPYQDARVVDGLRVSLVLLAPLAALATATGGANRAAHLLAEAEAAGAALADHTRSGVALALLAADATGRILWLTRHGAARRGGGAPNPLTRSPAGTAPPPLLRQAAVDGLLEAVQAGRRAVPPVPVRTADFRHLPPAGLVPAPGGVRPALFPPHWAQSVAPIPMGQLDAVFAAAEALAPYDLTAPMDAVRWYVPVPDAVFEPGLLVVPEVAQGFLDAVERFRTDVADALVRREALRGQAAGAEGRIDTDAIPAFTTDADALDGETGWDASADATDGLRDHAAEAAAAFDGWAATVLPGLLTQAQRNMIDFSANGEASGLRRGLAPLLADLDRGIDAADDVVDFGFSRVQADIYRLRQTMLDNEEATKLVTFPVLAGIAKGSNALATSKGLAEHFRSQKAAVTAPQAAGGGGEVRSLPTENRLLLRGISGGGGTVLRGSTMLAGFATPLRTDFGLSFATGLTAPASPGAVDQAYAGLFNAGRSARADEIALSTAAEARAGIAYASAIPGAFQDQRTLTIASRLETPAALAARTSALRIKADTLMSVNRLPLSMEGVTAPIVALDAPVAVIRDEEFIAFYEAIESNPDFVREAEALKRGRRELGTASDPRNTAVAVDFSALSPTQQNRIRATLDAMLRLASPIGAEGIADLVLARRLDPDPAEGGDESVYLASAVSILESVVAIYRAVEGRIAVLRGFLDATAAVVAKLTAIAVAWREALDEADRALAEARHDFRAATALLAEEEARIAVLEARRRAILADTVRVMVFARPRHLKPHGAGTTGGRVLAGVYEDPLPAALAAAAALPDDLATMLAILRDVPVGWFAAKDRLMEGWQAPKALDLAFHWAANAAAIRWNTGVTVAVARTTAKTPPVAAARPGKRGRAVAAAGGIAATYADMARRMLDTRARIDLGQIDRLSWAEKRARAEAELSLGDVIEGGAGAAGAKAALAELDDIGRVVSALFFRLRQAPVAIRLLWADRLSAYDGDPKLADVATLPGWFGLDAEARNAIGALHGWLFRRMAKGKAEAQSLMSDVVQVAVLLAANAETDEIVAARLTVEKTVGTGDSVELALDRGVPAIGTVVWFGLGGAAQVSGTVRDVLQDRVRVEIGATPAGRVTVGPATAVFVNTRHAGPGRHGR